MPRRGGSSRARSSAAAPPPASASSPASPSPPPPPPPLNAAPRRKIRIKQTEPPQAASAPTSETLPPTSSQTLPPKSTEECLAECSLGLTSPRRNPPRAAKRSEANAEALNHQRIKPAVGPVSLDVALSGTARPKIKFVTRHGEGAQRPRDEKLEQRIQSLTFKGIANGRVGSGSDVKNLAVVYDEDMTLHKIPDYLTEEEAKAEYEKPERLTRIMDRIIEEKLQGSFDLFKPDEVATTSLLAVHTIEHIKLVESLQSKNDKEREALAAKARSVYYSQGSTRAAFLAAGGAIKASTLVVEGMYNYSFALVRPPGHHAGKVGPSGFCLFNNVAVAVKHMLTKYEKKKIVILDFDVHHGDGTQSIFYDDRRVLVISIHRFENIGPSDVRTFPATEDGDLDYVGTEDGKGFNVNCPLPIKGAGDADYFAIWEEIVLPLIEDFSPDMIFVSAGFDAAAEDPIGDCELTPNGYATLVEMLMKFGNLVLVLEGGYNLDVLGQSAVACIKALSGDRTCIIFDRKGRPMPSTTQMIKKVKQNLSEVWDSFKLDKQRLQCLRP